MCLKLAFKVYVLNTFVLQDWSRSLSLRTPRTNPCTPDTPRPAWRRTPTPAPASRRSRWGPDTSNRGSTTEQPGWSGPDPLQPRWVSAPPRHGARCREASPAPSTRARASRAVYPSLPAAGAPLLAVRATVPSTCTPPPLLIYPSSTLKSPPSPPQTSRTLRKYLDPSPCSPRSSPNRITRDPRK